MSKKKVLYNVISHLALFAGLMLPMQMTALLILIFNSELSFTPFFQYLLGFSIMPTLVLVGAKVYLYLAEIIKVSKYNKKGMYSSLFIVMALIIVAINFISNIAYLNIFLAITLSIVNVFIAYYYVLGLNKLSDFFENKAKQIEPVF